MHKQLEQDMAARVRAGDLAGAATLGREALARYTAERARADASMTAAAASQEAALAQGRQIDAAAAAAKLARSKADVSSLRTMAADIQSDLGEILHAQGQLDAALPLYETALRGYPAPEMVHVYKVNRILAAMGALYRTRGDTPARAGAAAAGACRTAAAPRQGPPRRHRRRRRNGGATPALKDYAAAAPLAARQRERAERSQAPPARLAPIPEAQADIATGQGDRAGALASLEHAVAVWASAGEAGAAPKRKAQARVDALAKGMGAAPARQAKRAK
ncbi:tetratricopeptide repeat protein [Massilia sp. Se16.2.3]|uniref:tetratricopeptide repeat protein n=1 Tax=Massilia sp. Se16.2.3 TaxID=2709303 RepID=UPI001601CEF5|nr:tetratricopeptide repeat protein [Massilia sp. Se16.2.3]QNB00167.1 hypothetical protein G4G31_17310 [Massilia sp. Se16.2.3]